MYHVSVTRQTQRIRYFPTVRSVWQLGNPPLRSNPSDPVNSKRQHPLRRGFTLVELLVVVLIIAVLAAISMMLFKRIREMADRSTAMRNISQLQLANASYATDNNGRYVSFRVNDEDGNRIGFWFMEPQFLEAFRGSISKANGDPSLDVPVEMLDPKVVRARQNSWNKIYGSFGINVNGLDSSATKDAVTYYTVSNVAEPAQSMAFASATDLSVRYGSRFLWDGKEGKTSNSKMAYRHREKALIVYFDGHVGEVSKGDLEEIDKKRGGSKSAFWRPNGN